MNKRYRSLNFDERVDGTEIKYLIIHYTQGNLEQSLDWLTSSNALGQRVSCHYLICKQGEVYSLVDEDKRAWHAGVSAWEDDVKLNGTSIGIELVNSGDEEYTEPQMRSLESLASDIVRRHQIRPFHILGHSDISPEKKVDPGKYFDWKRFSQTGLGLYPEEVIPIPTSVRDVQQQLKVYGYAIENTGIIDFQTENVFRAFQLHFGSSDLNMMAAKLNWLLSAKQACGY